VFEIEEPFQTASPGTLVIPAPELRYAFATRFEESFVHDRVALDRTDAAVRGEEARVEVLALPEEGRPIDFTGAVGRFTIQTSAEPREVAAGESFRLSITIAGEGNFGRFESPRFVELERFDRLGTIEEPGEGRLTLRCDLVPRDERADEVPALALAYFDPSSPVGYRYARSEPIALRVLPRPPGTSAPGGESVRVATARGTGAPEGQRADWGAWIAGGLVIALIAVVAAVRRRASAA
jgi:hypothetical protein